MIATLSWRNVWRSKIRSLVIIAAIAVGLTGGVFSLALYNGMTQQKIRSAIDTETAHIQLHQEGFRQNKDIKIAIEEAQQKVEWLRGQEGVKTVVGRTIVSGMAASATANGGIEINGVIPEDEKAISTVHERLVEGSYFEEGRRKPILIGQKLAEKLDIGLRSKVVVTMQDMEGTIVGAAFRVVGIFKTSSSTFDEMNAFVQQKDLQDLIGGASAIHEIAVLMEDDVELPPKVEAWASKYPDLLVQDWRDIQPELGYMSEAMAQTNAIFLGVILFALAFGILNTMLMAVFERVREIGVLMAVGMGKFRIFRMIVTETVFLSITGAVVGLGLSIALVQWSGAQGINLEMFAEGFASYGIDSMIYPELSPDFYVSLMVMVFVTAILSSLYPAFKALKLHPVEAIRGDIE